MNGFLDALPQIGGGIVLFYAAASAAARIGLVPGRITKWWAQRWRQRIAREERDRVLDDIAEEFKPNGGGLREVVNSLRDGQRDIQLLLAQHIEETAPLVELFVREHQAPDA